MIKIPQGIDLWAHIDMLPDFLRVAKQSGMMGMPDQAWDRAAKWLDRVGKLKGVEEVIDGHMVWIKYRVQTRDYSKVGPEIDALRARIERLVRRYVKKT